MRFGVSTSSSKPREMIRRNNSSFGSFGSSDDPILPVYGGDKRRRSSKLNPALILIGVALLLCGVWMWRSKTPRADTPTITAQTDLRTNAGNGNAAERQRVVEDRAAQKRENVNLRKAKEEERRALRAREAREAGERAKAEAIANAAKIAAEKQKEPPQRQQGDPTEKKTPGLAEDEGYDQPNKREGPKLPDVKCSDRNPTAECVHWSIIGECSNNPGFMRAHCRCAAERAHATPHSPACRTSCPALAATA